MIAPPLGACSPRAPRLGVGAGVCFSPPEDPPECDLEVMVFKSGFAVCHLIATFAPVF